MREREKPKKKKPTTSTTVKNVATHAHNTVVPVAFFIK